MGCQARYEQLHNVEIALGQLERIGFGPGTEAYNKLWQERGAIMGKLGQPRAKQTILQGTISGMSPGVIRAWFDTEVGWLSEARATPWADPVYKVITFEEAQAILKREVTPELEQRLLTPTAYIGEV